MRHVLRQPPPLGPPHPRGRVDRPGAAGAGEGKQGVAQGLANLAWVGGAHTGKMFVCNQGGQVNEAQNIAHSKSHIARKRTLLQKLRKKYRRHQNFGLSLHFFQQSLSPKGPKYRPKS